MSGKQESAQVALGNGNRFESLAPGGTARTWEGLVPIFRMAKAARNYTLPFCV